MDESQSLAVNQKEVTSHQLIFICFLFLEDKFLRVGFANSHFPFIALPPIISKSHSDIAVSMWENVFQKTSTAVSQ